eukprot:TRINITY_DN15286_c0_g1_i1.p2 TRINITY_DN15286_c0_g1~~TRINITY_DN15286_c0_g1_i1.p2  ORF type:complete len:115 (+),score=23.47 TRINITY_DN15286_c0_g1_i1:86-430(+)
MIIPKLIMTAKENIIRENTKTEMIPPHFLKKENFMSASSLEHKQLILSNHNIALQDSEMKPEIRMKSKWKESNLGELQEEPTQIRGFPDQETQADRNETRKTQEKLSAIMTLGH